METHSEAHGGEPSVSRFILKLYITGQMAKSQRAIANLRRIAEEELGGQYELAIIDVLEQPGLAEDDKILATPTLIKLLPPPMRRIIGDLTNTEKVLRGLDLVRSTDDKDQQRGTPS